jgi:large subunit ribosomal protein L24
LQTTLLGLAIAFIIALVAALIGPYFIDWNQFRPQFEAEATQVIGAPVHVAGALDARLLPTPTLRLRSVVVGAANDLGKVHADKLDVEFSLGDLMRGQWRANELTIDGLAVDLGLDPKGRIDLPPTNGTFNLGSLSIDRLNLTGRVALHDAASHGTLELNDIVFSGDVRSLAGSVRGDGSFSISGARYPFRVSSGQTQDGSGTRVHLNIDPGERPSVDLEGVLSFESRAPRFEGALVLAAPAAAKAKSSGSETSPAPWKISAKVKVDPAAARLEQVEASYGTEDTALKATGAVDIRFGASSLLRASLTARQLDADRMIAKDGATAPARLLPALRALMATMPGSPMPAQIAFSAEQIMLGGRPLQNLEAELFGGAGSWTIRRLDFRAPGATQIAFDGGGARPDPSGGFAGALEVDSADPDTLVAWLQGRSEIAHRGQKPLRLRGHVSVNSDRIAIERLNAEIDGGAVEGRLAVVHQPSGVLRFEGALKADRLDLDTASVFARSLAGPQGDWPDQAQLSLEIGRATSAGQELRAFTAKFGYDPKTLILDQLKFGDANGVATEGAGSFDRVNASGKLALNSSAASLKQITALIQPLAPSLAARIDAMGAGPGPARLKLTLDVDKNAERTDRANARATIDIDSRLLKGITTITAKPEVAALRGIDLEKLRRSEIGVESKLSSERGSALLALLGLDRAIAAGEGPAQFEGSVSGVWHAPLHLKAKIWGAGLDADAEGSAEPWSQQAKASVNLRIRSADIGPLLDLKPSSDTLGQSIRLSSRLSLVGDRLTFDDLDSIVGGSRLRGRLALTAGEAKNIEGEIGLDQLVLVPAFALAIGAAGHDIGEPLGAGLLKGWRGRVAFQALRGAFLDGIELRPVSGTIRSDGQSLTLDGIKGGLGGGAMIANIDARPSADGIVLNARLEFSDIDGAALHYRGLQMPAGRTSMQMTLASQGRSVSALTGAFSGSGTVTLESAGIAGLDPRAFDAAIRASDSGQATDDAKLKRIVEPVLSAGSLLVAAAQIPFTVGDGRIRIGATTLDAQGARAIVSGGYDIPADQADIRASLASTALGSVTSRPEIQLFAAGPPDALNRTIDVAALSSWLAVRAIDRETRRLDAIERGEPLPPTPAALPLPATPDLNGPDQPLASVPLPGRHLRRFQPRPKAAVPRPPAAPPVLNPPVVSQRATPLPPPIEVRPAPAPLPTPAKPKPRPPLVIAPPPN